MFQHLVCTNWFEVDCHAQLAVRTPLVWSVGKRLRNPTFPILETELAENATKAALTSALSVVELGDQLPSL